MTDEDIKVAANIYYLDCLEKEMQLKHHKKTF